MAGRPTKYTEDIIDRMLEFFDDAGTMTLSDGRVVARLPTFEKFASDNDLTVATLDNWKNDPDKPLFFEAYKKCQAKQKDFLIQNAIYNNMNSTFAIFTAKNITDMKDKSEVDNNLNLGDKLKQVLIKFEE